MSAFDAGDQHQVATRGKRVRLAIERDDQEFRDMMAVPQFRAFVWRQLELCHVFTVSADMSNGNHTFFREGQRSVGLSLLRDALRLCPEHYQTMTAEADKRTKELNDGK